MRYCVNCGAMNDTDANFCSGCGKKFESAVFDATKKDFQVKSNFEMNNNIENNINAEANITGASAQTQETFNYQKSNPDFNTDFNKGDGITGDKYNGMSLASLILGICSIVFSFIVPILPLAAGIVGIVIGNKVKKYGDNGKAKAGRITSIIGIILIAIQVVIFIVAVIGIADVITHNPDFLERFYDMYY